LSREVSIRYLRLAARYLSLVAIDLCDVIRILRELGYQIRDRLPPPGFKGRLGGSGPIAVKGGVVVDVDTARHILGVSAPEPGLLISEFNILEEALSGRLRGYTKPYFYEILAEFEVTVEGVDFYSLMSRAGEPVPIAVISEALGEDACLLGFKVGKRGARPEGTEWMEVEVVPSPLKPDDVLYISIIYRSESRDKVLSLLRDLPSSVLTIAESLTREGNGDQEAPTYP